jgi:hypothetical protein
MPIAMLLGMETARVPHHVGGTLTSLLTSENLLA